MASSSNIPEKDLPLIRGDSDEILVTVREPTVADPTVLEEIRLDQAVDDTADRPVILRFAAKEDPEDPRTQAVIYKDNSDPEDIQVLDQTTGVPPGGSQGQAVIYVDKQDTEDREAGPAGSPILYPYDLEVTRQDFLRAGAQAGTVSLVAGETAVVGVGTAFTQARRGDVLQPLGGINDGRPAVIQEIVDDTNIVVHHSNWVNEPGIAFELRRGRSFTAARGNICLEVGQVKD